MSLSDVEFGRRLVHSLGLAFPVVYFITDMWIHVIILLGIATGVGFILEYFRLYRDYSNFLYEHLTREYESDKFAGYYLYIIGMFISSIVFNQLVAISAMIILAIGDPIGGILGDVEVDETKSATPFIAVFIFSLMVSSFILNVEVETTTAIIIGFLGGVGGAIGDYKKVIVRDYIIDDNLVIPLLSGSLMQLAVLIMS